MATCSLNDNSVRIYAHRNAPRVSDIAAFHDLKIAPVCEAPHAWHLRCEREQLILFRAGEHPLRLDKKSIARRVGKFPQSLLGRACSVSTSPKILDALSGWGTDGNNLAYAGCDVVGYELSPLVYFLNRDRSRWLNSDFQCRRGDVSKVLRDSTETFDVIYIDPMFPPHGKGSLPNRSMQVLAELAQDCDITELFELAMQRVSDRIVVKTRRHQQSELPVPSWSLKGKTIRFDVYKR